MNLVLGTNEKEVKNWNYVDRDDNLEFDNNIVVTDKRFIYQRKLKNANKQNSISRYEVPLENVKSINSFYGFKQNLLWLIVGFVGILVFILGFINLVSELEWASNQRTEPYVTEAIIFMLFGIAVDVIGFFLHLNPDKSPIKVKKPVFSIVIETKGVEGKSFSIGGGNAFALRNKLPIKTILLFIPPICIFGIPYYYLIKKANKSCKLDIPEEYACEILDSIGSVIF